MIQSGKRPVDWRQSNKQINNYTKKQTTLCVDKIFGLLHSWAYTVLSCPTSKGLKILMTFCHDSVFILQFAWVCR